ncbi:hypothetical protein Tco_1151692 [Tanacetum coccineum]
MAELENAIALLRLSIGSLVGRNFGTVRPESSCENTAGVRLAKVFSLVVVGVVAVPELQSFPSEMVHFRLSQEVFHHVLYLLCKLAYDSVMNHTDFSRA